MSSTRPLSVMSYIVLLQKKLKEEETKREKNLKQGKKRLFTSTEDQVLKILVNIFGDKRWNEIASFIPGKTNRQCRERYKIYLAPGINREEWTKEDDDKLIYYISQHGPKWSALTKYFPGRTANSLKNRYNVHINPIDRNRRGKSSSSTDDSIILPGNDLSEFACLELPIDDQLQFTNEFVDNFTTEINQLI